MVDWIGPNVSLRALCALAVVGLFAAPASAWSAAPPSNLTVTTDGDDALLSWDAPDGEAPDAFRVYRDGRLALVVESTSATIHAASTYAVTALYGDFESAPAVVAEASTPSGGDCDPLPITINTTNPPFIYPKPQLDCFNWLLDDVEELLERGPPAPGHIQIPIGIEQ